MAAIVRSWSPWLGSALSALALVLLLAACGGSGGDGASSSSDSSGGSGGDSAQVEGDPTEGGTRNAASGERCDHGGSSDHTCRRGLYCCYGPPDDPGEHGTCQPDCEG